MSSSYIVRALFHLMKPKSPPSLPAPQLHCKDAPTLIAHVCDSHSASQENETARKGERCIRSGACDIIYTMEEWQQ